MESGTPAVARDCFQRSRARRLKGCGKSRNFLQHRRGMQPLGGTFNSKELLVTSVIAYLRIGPCFLAVVLVAPLLVGAEVPAVVGHRGLLLDAPENTLANFTACLELRLGFEFD